MVTRSVIADHERVSLYLRWVVADYKKAASECTADEASSPRHLAPAVLIQPSSQLSAMDLLTLLLSCLSIFSIYAFILARRKRYSPLQVAPGPPSPSFLFGGYLLQMD
jgi:hypothetical protein